MDNGHLCHFENITALKNSLVAVKNLSIADSFVTLGVLSIYHTPPPMMSLEDISISKKLSIER